MSVNPTEQEIKALMRHAEEAFGGWTYGKWVPGDPKPDRPGSYSIYSDVPVDDPCPVCNGSGQCARGCTPPPGAEPDWPGGKVRVRGNASAQSCSACTVYGDCMNCLGSGVGRRPCNATSVAIEVFRKLQHDPDNPDDYSHDGESIKFTYEKLATLLRERVREPTLF